MLLLLNSTCFDAKNNGDDDNEDDDANCFLPTSRNLPPSPAWDIGEKGDGITCELFSRIYHGFRLCVSAVLFSRRSSGPVLHPR